MRALYRCLDIGDTHLLPVTGERGYLVTFVMFNFVNPFTPRQGCSLELVTIISRAGGSLSKVLMIFT